MTFKGIDEILMELNHWTQTLRGLYDHALAKYRDGQRDANAFFNAGETAFLASIGLKPINVYDYAEDFIKSDEPDWDTVLLMLSARRDYFLHEMSAKWTATPIRETDLPPKIEALAGIEWLPRIIMKANAFLTGALPSEIMYCCGGDRNFLKTHRIHPADFLRVVWATKCDKNKLADYVKSSAGS